jgi:glycosyltransferase involved in cell wall biosynthesis
MDKKLKILFLPRWYPHRYDPMPGLFIQQQAEVISSFSNVAVLYLHEDTECPNKFEIDTSDENGVQVVRVYYRVPAAGSTPVDRVIKFCRFLRANYLGLKMLRGFQPDLVHVHVLTRQGIIALILKIFSKIPYVITEHWSRYYPENGTYRGLLRKWITGFVVKHASAVIAVSEKLKQVMMTSGLRNSSFYVIGNPVDMERFTVNEQVKRADTARKRIIHVSCFEDKSKNISGFLNILSYIKKKRTDFECRLIGEGPDWERMKECSIELGLSSETVSFAGLKEKDELVKEINEADFLVLSSHYETFGSVIIETLACGVPVVSFDVGIADEVIDNSNGIIVPAGDEHAMKAAIDRMLDQCRNFNRAEIRQGVINKYNCQVISDQLASVYNTIFPEKEEKKI